MTATTTAEVAELKRSRVPEQPPGADAPGVPEDCYRIEPGEARPEYYDPDLPGCELAMIRAKFLSVSGPPQHVTRLRPGTPSRTFRWYRSGQDIRPVT
jgi:hypothetical protein